MKKQKVQKKLKFKKGGENKDNENENVFYNIQIHKNPLEENEFFNAVSGPSEESEKSEEEQSEEEQSEPDGI